MSDVRELLGRLGPTNVRFDVGRGGGVDCLTDIDLAGALGMVPAGLGREVLEAAWCPGVAALRRHRLRDAVVGLVVPELQRQARRLSEAHLDLQLAEAAVAWSNSYTDVQRRHVERARQVLAQVRAETWPTNTVEHLPALARAAVDEIREGLGRSDHATAVAVRIDPSNYAKLWRPVYRWLLQRMIDAESVAAMQMAAAVRKGAA